MKRIIVLTSLLIIAFSLDISQAFADTIHFRGQASLYAILNDFTSPTGLIGGRYIPQLDYKRQYGSTRFIDFEISTNMYLQSAIAGKSTDFKATMKPYRAWVRYSSPQLELRVGLQKLNFGTATLLRPLMWFDRLDPKDPLQLTDGVYGGLGRYYFQNNANIWFWILYGNREPRSWDYGKTISRIPEFGGRLQTPLFKGEAGLSVHHRVADIKIDGLPSIYPDEVAEFRIGLDGKWDIQTGIWFEATWITKNRKIGVLTNQHNLCFGTDYTFGIGNGLNIMIESILITLQEIPFKCTENNLFTAASMNYPLSFFQNISTMLYFDHRTNKLYSFFSYNHQFTKFNMHCLFWLLNGAGELPMPSNASFIYSGKGIQVIFAYKH